MACRTPLLALLALGTLAVGALGLGTLDWASAGPDTPFDAHDHRRLFHVRDTNAARHAIEEARRALARGETLRGLNAAQRVLDEMSDDFFLQEAQSSVESVLWSSAAEVVRDILAGLNAEQRAAYERLARPAAAPLLARSLRDRDEAGLREILRRFSASSIGVKAARILADVAAEAGRPRDAARYLREGLRYAPRDVALWKRLIDALAAEGDRRALSDMQLPDAFEGAPEAEVARMEARRLEALAAIPKARDSTGWPMWGGVPARNAHLDDKPPMPNRLRWQERMDWMERRLDRMRYMLGRNRISRRYREMLSNFRPVQPVLEGRLLYVADGRSVHAFDIYSGREVWAFAGVDRPGLPLVREGEMQAGRTSLERAFSPVVAGDLLIATVESPHLYQGEEHLQGVEISAYLPRRVLVALDRTTGQLRWSMGQEGLDRLRLSQLSIISAPVVAEGLVLALGSQFRGVHNVSFLAFDLKTGALRWHRSLGSGQQELNLFGAPLKELAASPIAVSEGVAYASTGLGFVAAVDIRSGIPRWLASYDIIPVRKVQLWYDAPIRIPRIAPSPPVVQGDLLVVAPTDGRHVHAFDRRTGKLVWREAYDTSLILNDVTGHFLGVVNDGRRDVVLLTDHGLRARDLKTGKTVWRSDFAPERDRVIGRGAVAGTSVLVPTQNGLQRFNLKAEGAYKGMVPWPEDATPGNVLPLGRVLIMVSRSEVQWFYDWAAIERDVERRRKENPDDPTILIEAGEMYLRGGGETERARKVFRQARDLARRVERPQAEERALLGLFQTWVLEGDQRAAFPERAIAAYRKALPFARRAEDRVLARLRIHRLLEEGTARARIKNLEALVDEAEKARVSFEVSEGKVPARAAALFLLAREHLGRERPTEAVNTLQRVLREERDAPLPRGRAGDLARKHIAQILEHSGTLPYRSHERKARALLKKAVESKDAALLDRLLAEYPNAASVTDALLQRARGLLAEDDPLGAAVFLRRLVGGAPADHRLVPVALAELARAYRRGGAPGAAEAAVQRLAEGHASARFSWEGHDTTGAAYARAFMAQGTPPRPDTSPEAELKPPLREVHFEQVGEDDMARPVILATESPAGTPLPPPLALMMRGQTLVAIDLRKGRVGWSVRTGHCPRGAVSGKALVLALRRAFRGIDTESGKELWRRETGALVQDMQVANGQVYALLKDLTVVNGKQRLVAFDAHRGTVLWTIELENSNYRSLTPWRDRVLLQQVRYGGNHPTAKLLVFDGFDGVQLHALTIPLQIEGKPLILDDLYCLAGSSRTRRKRLLMAYDLHTGRLKWQRSIVGRDSICALAADGNKLLVLRGDGTLRTHSAADGTAVHETRIYVGDGGRPCPFPGTPLLIRKGRMTMIPWVRQPALSLVQYDRRTGKLIWDAPYEPGLALSKAVLMRRGDIFCSMISYARDGVQNILVRLVDARTGKLLQEIEPEGLAKANWIPTLIEGHGTLVIMGKSGASIFRTEGESK